MSHEHRVGFVGYLGSICFPANQMLNERFGDRGVDVVMRHLIADAVGVPAQGQFGKIAGADDDAVVEIGQAKQVAGALAGLHVFEGDVVDGFAAGKGVIDVLKHLPGTMGGCRFLRR